VREDKTRLEVGDVIRVHNPLLSEDKSLYRVYKIDGRKAFTDFRIFNTRIYGQNTVYEYGHRQSPIYNNRYTVEDTQ
jgi:hypothetical protein